MMVYSPAVVIAVMESFDGKPARCLGRVANTLSIALGLVCFLVDFGMDEFLLFPFWLPVPGHCTPSGRLLILPSACFVGDHAMLSQRCPPGPPMSHSN